MAFPECIMKTENTQEVMIFGQEKENMLSKVEARGIWIIPQWQSIKDLRVKTALPGRYLATICF